MIDRDNRVQRQLDYGGVANFVRAATRNCEDLLMMSIGGARQSPMMNASFRPNSPLLGPFHAKSSVVQIDGALPTTRRPSRWPLLIIAGVVAIASILAWRLGYFETERRNQLIAAVGDVRGSPTASAIFIGCWVLAVVLCLPTTVLTIVGGALFGTTRGALYSWSAALIGTVVAHSIAGKFNADAVRRLFGKHHLLETLRSRADVPFLIRMRLMPIAPFGVLDYVAGLAGVPTRTILLATAIGVGPGILAYAFAGDRLRLGIGAPAGEGGNALMIAGVISLCMVAVATVPWVVKKVRERTHSVRDRTQ